MNLKLLWYCTKAKGKNYYLRKLPNGRYCLSRDKGESLNGKIACVSDYEVEEIYFHQDCGYTHKLCETELLKHSRLSYEQLKDYLHGYSGYAIHIKNLNVFDKPKELSSVYRIVDVGGMLLTDTLKKAPQNMMYVSINEWEYYFYNPEDKRVLISVHPEWLCLILNGLKDVELRRKVLKEML